MLRSDDDAAAHGRTVNRAMIGVRARANRGHEVRVAIGSIARPRWRGWSPIPCHVVSYCARGPVERDVAGRNRIGPWKELVVAHRDRRGVTTRWGGGGRGTPRGGVWIRQTAAAALNGRENGRNHQPTRHGHSSSIREVESCDFGSRNVQSYTGSRQTDRGQSG